MMRKFLAALAPLVLAGCSQPMTVTQQPPSFVVNSVFDYAGSGKKMLVVIHGVPASADTATFRRTVVAAMQGRTQPPTTFTDNPAEAATPQNRVVLAFNPAAAVDPQDLCREPADKIATAPARGRIDVAAAFCSGNDSLSSVTGTIAEPLTDRNSGLTALVGQTVTDLFPPETRPSAGNPGNFIQ